VHDNIKYDLAYASVNLSAKETLQKKAGVCDEFSTLLISLARALHYRAAYVVGYAYGEGYRTENAFVPHGWTEICGSDCYVIDPTWPEGGSLDATHIKFITLPDSLFVQASLSAIGTGNFSAKFEPVNSLERLETNINILESRSSPPITTTSTLLDSELWTGYAVMKTDMSTAGCALTSVKASSCLSQGKQFIPSLTPDRTVSFCSSRTLFTIFQLPTGLNEETRYNCELSIIPSAGTRNDANVVLIDDAAPTGSIELTVDSTSLKPSESFGVTASGATIFTDTGLYANDSARWTAPSTGFTVYAYSDGLLQSQAIAVNGEAPPKVQTPAPEVEKPSEPAGVPENPPASLPEKSFFDNLIDAITNFFNKLFGR
jgi:hypothetical protein